MLWTFGETFELRRLILSLNDGLGLCIKSLLRQDLKEGKPITEEKDPANSDVLADSLRNAIGWLNG